MPKIKKDDTVMVIAGKEKGITGKVLHVDGSRVTVEGVNRVKRHTREQTGDMAHVSQSKVLTASSVTPANKLVTRASRLAESSL